MAACLSAFCAVSFIPLRPWNSSSLAQVLYLKSDARSWEIIGWRAMGLDCTSAVGVTYHIDTLVEKTCIHVSTSFEEPSSVPASQR
jgi:hypothetical protein